MFLQFPLHALIEFLQELQATILDESPPRLHVVGEELGKLLEDVLLDLDRGVTEEGLQSLEMGAFGKDSLEGTLGLCLEIVGGGLVDHAGEEVAEHVSLGESTGVVGGMASNLAERPGRSGLDVVLRLGNQGLAEGHDALGDNDREGKCLGEGSNVTDSHDAGELGITLGLADVVDESGGSSSVDYELGELRCVLGNLPDAGGRVLANEGVIVLEAVEDIGENLSLNDDLGKVDRVLGNLCEASANLALELGIGVDDERGEVGNGPSIDNSLSELRAVLANVGHGRGGDTLKGDLRLLDAKDEEGDRSCIDNILGQLGSVLGNVSDSPSGRLLHGGVELLKAGDESIESTGVNDSLSEVRGVLGDGPKNKGGSLLVEPVLLGKGVDELRKDLISNDCFGEVIGIVCEATEREGGRLLDGGHVIEEKGAEQLHHSGVLHDLDILGAGSRLGDSLG